MGVYFFHPASCRKCGHTHQLLFAHCARVRLARWSESCHSSSLVSNIDDRNAERGPANIVHAENEGSANSSEP